MPAIAVARWNGSDNYQAAVRAAGLVPVDPGLNGAEDLSALLLTGHDRLGQVAGLLLTGGADVDPALYGERPHPKTVSDPARDAFELALLREVLARDLPVLAICRGHQLLNVALGGSLVQDIPEHAADYDTEGHPSSSHEVTLVGEGPLREVFDGERVLVNSRHHQVVTPERLAPGLHATALSDEGYVEAVQSERHTWVVGVQWHPEREEPQLPGFAAASARLLALFAKATAKVASA